jgi:hypothetical protein
MALESIETKTGGQEPSILPRIAEASDLSVVRVGPRGFIGQSFLAMVKGYNLGALDIDPRSYAPPTSVYLPVHHPAE